MFTFGSASRFSPKYIWSMCPMPWSWAAQRVRAAPDRALATTGRSKPVKIAIIPITTSSSMSVNARGLLMRVSGKWSCERAGGGRATSVGRPRRRGPQVEEVQRRPGQEPFVFFPLRGRQHLPGLLLGRGDPLPVALVEPLHPGLEPLLDLRQL